MFEQADVGRRSSVVELVDDDDVEARRVDRGEVDVRQRLDAREHVPPGLGPLSADVEFAEGRVARGQPEHRRRLLQDLVAVRDEQERRVVAHPFVAAQACVVESRDERLAGSRGGDDQVAPASVANPFGFEPIEDRTLERVRGDVDPRQRQVIVARGGLLLCGEGRHKPIAVVALDVLVFPEGLKGKTKAVDHRRGLGLRQADVPLESVDEGAVREVRAANVGGGEA